MRIHRMPYIFITLIILMMSCLLVSNKVMGKQESSSLKRNEQRIYVPYDKLEEIFGPENRAILMPYEDFLKLWNQVPMGPTPTPEIPPPVDAMIVKARYHGTVINNLAHFNGTLKIIALKKSWSRLPLQISGAAITNANISPGTLYLTRGTNGYELALPGKDVYKLNIEFAAPILDEEGNKKLSLNLPGVPVSSIELLLPEPGLKVKSPANLPITSETIGKRTRVTILNSGVSRVMLTWRPSIKQSKKVKPILFANDHALITMGEGYIRNKTTIDFSVLQSPESVFRFKIPPGVQILEVDTQTLETWNFNDITRILTVKLFQEKSSHTVTIEFEKSLKDVTGTYGIPFLEVVNTSREKGVIGLVLSAPLSVHVTGSKGLTQVGFKEFAQHGAPVDNKPVQAFRFIEHPIKLQVEIKKLLPEVYTTVYGCYKILDEGIETRYTVGLNVTRAPFFHMKIILPAKMGRVDMGGPKERSMMNIDDYRVVTKNRQKILEIDFSRPVMGQHRFKFTGWLGDVDYGNPVKLPMIRTESERETGYIGIAALPKYKVTTEYKKGLFPVSLAELKEHDGFWDPGTVMGYRYHQHPIAISIAIDIRPTKVTAVTINKIRVEEDMIRGESVVNYDIKYNGLDRFQLSVPGTIGKNLHIEGVNIKEKTSLEKENRYLWTILLQSPVLGAYSLVLSYDLKLDQENKQKEKVFQFPAPRILSVERDTGYVSVTKEQDLEVTPQVVNLERIDPKELPSYSEKEGIFLAYQYVVQPYTLNLGIVKHAYEKVVDAIINRCQLTTVLTKEYHVTNQVVFEIQNKGKQFLELKLPADSKIMSLSVDGIKTRHSRRESDNMILIPLSQVDETKQVFYTRMVYEYQIKKNSKMGVWGVLKFHTPESSNILVQKTRWEVYLPRNYQYFPPGGNMNRLDLQVETGWGLNKMYLSRNLPLQTRGKYSQGRLVQDNKSMQTTGSLTGKRTPSTGNLEINIIKEGVRMVFSRLDGPGNLKLGFMGKKTFSIIDFMVFCVTFVIASYMTRYKGIPTSRVLVRGIILVLVLMAFAHPFYLNLLDSGLYAMILFGILYYAPVGWEIIKRIRLKRSTFYTTKPGNKSGTETGE